jgi:oxygen-independent coproporphyrinogen-3 oxidase
MSLLRAPPLSLYVHLPWCVRKCPYCDFNSHAQPEAGLPEERYVTALLADLEVDLPLVGNREIQTVFLGGGTPSLFAPESLAKLLTGIRARTPVAPDAEITMEANPGTIERGRFAGYREAGINRVSLGAQSFAPVQLQRLGRIHAADDTRRAVAELRAAGFANFNLDLMFALPEQTVDEALADVEQALELSPWHLSHYQLTLEPGTVFWHRPPPLPDDDLAWEIQLACHARLRAAGFEQYEVSAWTRPGHACRHNLNYWQFGDYLGIGAGAHGKLTRPESGEILRTTRPRQPRDYLDRIATGGSVSERLPVAPRERPFEYMLNALRLPAGFQVAEYEQRTGLGEAEIAAPLELLKSRGLLESEGSHWRPTERGFQFLNDLHAAFMP